MEEFGTTNLKYRPLRLMESIRAPMLEKPSQLTHLLNKRLFSLVFCMRLIKGFLHVSYFSLFHFHHTLLRVHLQELA